MSRMKQLVVYAKVAILCIVALFVLLVVWKNRSYETRFWPWAVDEPVATLWLMLATSVASVAVFWVVVKVRRVFHELGEVRRERQRAEAAAQQSRRQVELAEQEQRIDAKLKQALGENNSQAEK